MSNLTAITLNPTTVLKGGKSIATLAVDNPDRTSTITGVDETRAHVTVTLDVHTNLQVLVGQGALLPSGAAPAGSIVVFSDNAADQLSVDPATPLAVDITAG